MGGGDDQGAHPSGGDQTGGYDGSEGDDDDANFNTGCRFNGEGVFGEGKEAHLEDGGFFGGEDLRQQQLSLQQR